MNSASASVDPETGDVPERPCRRARRRCSASEPPERGGQGPGHLRRPRPWPAPTTLVGGARRRRHPPARVHRRPPRSCRCSCGPAASTRSPAQRRRAGPGERRLGVAGADRTGSGGVPAAAGRGRDPASAPIRPRRPTDVADSGWAVGPIGHQSVGSSHAHRRRERALPGDLRPRSGRPWRRRGGAGDGELRRRRRAGGA